jgi:hypothetical protein
MLGDTAATPAISSHGNIAGSFAEGNQNDKLIFTSETDTSVHR